MRREDNKKITFIKLRSAIQAQRGANNNIGGESLHIFMLISGIFCRFFPAC